MRRTKIAWVKNTDGTQGYVWNIVTGCKHNCSYCYARRIARRFGKTRQEKSFMPAFHMAKLFDPLKIKKPSTIFVSSMGDLFGSWIPIFWIEKVLKIVAKCPQHRFLFLTKNPNRYESFLFLLNSWIGYTATSTKNCCFDFRGKGNFYLSAEPLLGEVYIKDNLKWIIIGSLNQNGKPVHPDNGGTRKEWVLSLIEQADKYKIPVFIKSEMYKLYTDLPQRQELPYLNKEKMV